MPITVITSGPISTDTDPPVRGPLLAIIQEVCAVIGLTVPDSVFGQTTRELVELQSLANEMAYRIAVDTHDWTKLKQLVLLTGDGVSEGFYLPDDYARMLKTSRVFSSTNTTYPLTHYPDTDRWLAMTVQNFTTGIGSWTMIGDEIYIKPALGDGATAQFYYLSNRYALDAAGEPKTAFTSDDDAFRLNDRLLKLGMIWQWKANKGFAYSEDMANYETALSIQAGSDKGSNILTSGSRRINADVTLPYPGPLG